VAGYLNNLSPEKREALQQQAFHEGDTFLRDRLKQLEGSGDEQMSAIYREKLLSDLVQTILAASNQTRF